MLQGAAIKLIKWGILISSPGSIHPPSLGYCEDRRVKAKNLKAKNHRRIHFAHPPPPVLSITIPTADKGMCQCIETTSEEEPTASPWLGAKLQVVMPAFFFFFFWCCMAVHHQVIQATQKKKKNTSLKMRE